MDAAHVLTSNHRNGRSMKKTSSLMSVRERQGCTMRPWHWYNLTLSRENGPFGGEFITCIRDENVTHAQLSDQQLHRHSECHALNKTVVFTTPGKRVSSRTALSSSSLTQSTNIFATGSVEGTTAHHSVMRSALRGMMCVLSGTLHCEDEFESDPGESVTQNPAQQTTFSVRKP